MEPATTEEQQRAAFEAAMEEIYHLAKSKAGYNATRFLMMVREQGGLKAAHQLLRPGHVSDGFAELWQLGFADLTVEALVLRPEFQSLFAEEELNEARARLGRSS